MAAFDIKPSAHFQHTQCVEYQRHGYEAPQMWEAITFSSRPNRRGSKAMKSKKRDEAYKKT